MLELLYFSNKAPGQFFNPKLKAPLGVAKIKKIKQIDKKINYSKPIYEVKLRNFYRIIKSSFKIYLSIIF